MNTSKLLHVFIVVLAFILLVAGLEMGFAQSGSNVINFPWPAVFHNILTVNSPGGNFPVWKKYTLTEDGTNWEINGTDVAVKAGDTQLVNIIGTTSANFHVDRMFLETKTICTLGGATVSAEITSIGGSSPCGAGAYYNTPYDIVAAVSDTNHASFTPLTGACQNDAHTFRMTLTAGDGGDPGGALTNVTGCVVDIQVLWAVLP